MSLAARLRDPLAVDEEWLLAGEEAPLDSDLPLIDAHHHVFWDRPMRYRVEDLLADLTSGHNVRATVYVEGEAIHRPDGPQHLRSVGETEFANGLAAIGAAVPGPLICAAIVAAVDLQDAFADQALTAHAAAAGERLRGVRVNAYYDERGVMSQSPPRGLLSAKGFREGYSLLGEHQLVCDIFCFHPQLAEVADLAAAFPDTVIVLNHLGGPLGGAASAQTRERAHLDWLEGMNLIAACANVYVKLGGLTNPFIQDIDFRSDASGPSSARVAEALRRFVEPVFELFGPARCMFESNFPIDKPTVSYVNLWNAFKRLATALDPDGRALVLGGTAGQVYGLGGCLERLSSAPPADPVTGHSDISR